MKPLIAVLSYPVLGSIGKGEGLTTPARVLAAVKQACLLFDHIAPLYLGTPKIKGEKYADKLEDAKTCTSFSDEKIWFDADLSRLVNQVTADATPEAASMADGLAASNKKKSSLWTIGDSVIFYDEVSRIISCALRETRGIDSIPLLFGRPAPITIVKTENRPVRMSDVLQIVINAFPRPDGATPIEQIIEFRQNALARGNILELRRWMKKLASSDVSVEDAAEELEWLLHEYENHMRIQRMKITHGTLETLITTGAEVLEAVTKLKFGTLAKIPFAIRQREIALLEAERSAPGREVAYIAEARNKFRR